MNAIKPFLAIALLSLAQTSTHAGILGDMNSMFMSNSTASGVITTKDRVGVFGGSLSMRAPVLNFTLVSFDPPRVDAGCGGVDLFGGSFTFLSEDKLIEILRAVGANAKGLAFKAAIKMISPSLDSLIGEFQTLLQNLNNLAKNSCMLAHQIVDPAEKAINTAIHGEGSVASQRSSIFSDSISGLQGYLSDANNYFKKQGEVNPRSGNQVMKAIIGSAAGKLMGQTGVANFDASLDDETDPNSLNNRVLISTLGYEISGIPCQKSNEDGTSNTSGATSVSNLSQLSCTGEAILTLDDIIRGGGTGSTRPGAPLKLYKCVNPVGFGTPDAGGFDPQICTNMQITDFNYPGIRAYVNTMLFGDPDPANLQPTSIVGKYNSGTSFTFSTAEAKFLQTARLPIIRLLNSTSNPDSRVAIAQRLTNVITDCVAAKMGEALYKGVVGARRTDGYTFNPRILSRIDIIQNEYLKKNETCDKDETVLQMIQQINEGVKLRAANIK